MKKYDEIKMDRLVAKVPTIKQRVLLHDRIHRRCVRMNKIISTIHILLTSMIGSLTTIQMTTNEPYVTYSIFVIGWFLALVTGIMNFSKYPNQIDAHHQAIVLYTGLLDQIHETESPESRMVILKEYRRIKRAVPYVGVVKD